MANPSARLLRLLSLFQSRPRWSASELADRLETTTRTIRRDVAKLRELGYPVDATVGGAGGGYQLGRGALLPPLLLDDEEAVVVVAALHLAAQGALRGLEHEALAALAKLEQLLPSAIRERVDTIRSALVEVVPTGAPVDASTLLTLARACRGNQRVRLTYRGEPRTIEPYRLSVESGRWYLLSRDAVSRQWRTLRLDSIADAVLTGHEFVHEVVQRGVPREPDAEGVTVVLETAATLTQVRAYIPRAVGATVTTEAERVRVTMLVDDREWILRFLSRLPFLVEVIEPTEVRRALRERARGLAQLNT